MCRHLGYVGPAVRLADLIIDQPHSLLVQSYAPNDMRGGGTINVDGFGAGWFSPAADQPARAIRYRRAGPIWADASFADLARQSIVTATVAAVRSATAGMGAGETACAPFTDGHWLFSLNGRIEGWPGTASALASSVPIATVLSLDAPTDSALLWAVLRHRLTVGVDPADVLAALVAEVLAAAPASRLNLLLSDGATLWATTVTHALWSRTTADSAVLASEPFDDDPAWTPVPEHSLVVARPGAIEITPLRTASSGPTTQPKEAHAR